MIRKCNCGAMKTVQPFKLPKELPWICPDCANKLLGTTRRHTAHVERAIVEVRSVVAVSRRSKLTLIR